MNKQPYTQEGFYLDCENKLHKIINLAFNKNNINSYEFLIIYQPQYTSFELKKNTLFAIENDKFFEDILIKNVLVPRFTHLGNSEEQVKINIAKNKIKIKPNPVYRTESMINQNIEELMFENYVIKGFAKHAETNEMQIIYTRPNYSLLSIVSKENLFDTTGINPNNKTIAKYLKEL